MYIYIIFFFKQKTAYDMRISDWSSDVCSSDLPREYLAEPDKATAVREHLNKALAPDGFSVVVVGGKALLTERQGSGGIVEPFIKKVATLDFDTVQMEIRSEEHTSELQSLMRISYAVFCLKKQKTTERSHSKYTLIQNN